MISRTNIPCENCGEDLTAYANFQDAVEIARREQGTEIYFVVRLSEDARLKREDRELARRCTTALSQAYGHQCLNCGSRKHLVVDHIIPLVSGGDSSLDNLQLLCKSCNIKKGLKSIDYRPFPFPNSDKIAECWGCQRLFLPPLTLYNCEGVYLYLCSHCVLRTDDTWIANPSPHFDAAYLAG